MEEIIFYIPIEGRHNLCCIICDINPDEVADTAAKSFFHWQTLKCRLLVNLMQDSVIGSPMKGTDHSFYIITTKNFYQNSSLVDMFKRLNLMVSGPLEVTSEAYISCIKYTFEFVLAPKWNRVTRQLFIKGREFLTNIDMNPAIKMFLSLVTNTNLENEDDEIMVKLLPYNVKLFPLKLKDLGLPNSIVDDFLNNSTEMINVGQSNAIRVSVLPSMRKGRLITIYKRIPDSCPFKTWTELRRHWKNMYGYRLPETDEGILFYEIYFPIAGVRLGNYFVYPDICVKEEITQLPCKINSMAIADKFMKNLIEIMPKMCSRELIFNKKSLKDTAMIVPRELENTTAINETSTAKNSEKSDQLLVNNNDSKLDDCNRQLTTLMSPTSSLMGKRANTTNIGYNLDNLKKIKKIHESQPSMNHHLSLTNRFHPKQITKTSGIIHDPVTKSVISNSSNQKRVNIFSPVTRTLNNQIQLNKCSIFQGIFSPLANQENVINQQQVKK
ncbi:hypothetical protein PV327_003576 [Microctonus hyperodae]|uniref:DUF4708 domain-containing protein n=1 Tax=Microctonus hyperodae TaxID=165561 RepID=A0AA39L113_MICHY|nr:hypothetical protein PV327_003576 [Microctonus hyperodae]